MESAYLTPKNATTLGIVPTEATNWAVEPVSLKRVNCVLKSKQSKYIET